MPISQPALQRVLNSIEARNLVLLCGAGLSIPDPSGLMSAVAVAKRVYDAYAPTQVLPLELREDIDKLAGYFLANKEFEALFINRLVPWNDLAGVPNDGHAAVADLLLTGAAKAALSANFDVLIEHWASRYKVSLRGALNAEQAINYKDCNSPLLKFHGCMNLDRERTLWTQKQLDLPQIKDRVESCKAWMKLHLAKKDLLVIGFWTDWGYFNEVLVSVLSDNETSSITVVDPQPVEELEKKAPELWGILSKSDQFEHVKASGNNVLPLIRSAFSKVWTRKLYAKGANLYKADKGIDPPAGGFAAPDLDVSSYYDFRRDSEGVPMNRAAREWEPNASTAITGYTHLLMQSASEGRRGAWYVRSGKTIRVVHGAGEGLETIKERFVEPPTAPQADIVICAGSIEQGVPGDIVRPGIPAGIVRPGSSTESQWMTLERAKRELAL